MFSKINFGWEDRIGPRLTFNINKKQYGICLCHRREDRSLKISGYVFPLCARCTGILSGFFLGIWLISRGYNIPAVYSAIITIPLLIDYYLQSSKNRESTNIMRLATGLPFGVGLLYIGEYLI